MKFHLFGKEGGAGQKSGQPGDASPGIFRSRKPLDSLAPNQQMKEFLMFRDLKAWHSMAKELGKKTGAMAERESRYNPIISCKSYAVALAAMRKAMSATTAAGCLDGLVENERRVFEMGAQPERLRISDEEVKMTMKMVAGNSSENVYMQRVPAPASGTGIEDGPSKSDSRIQLVYPGPTWKYAKTLSFSTIQQLHEAVLAIHAQTCTIADFLRNKIINLENGQQPMNRGAQSAKP